jgi:hypothetical protein
MKEADFESRPICTIYIFLSKSTSTIHNRWICPLNFSELPAQLPAQKPVRTAQTQTSLIRCSKLIPNRRGGFSTPRAQFINNGFGLGEFLGKRGHGGSTISSNEPW